MKNNVDRSNECHGEPSGIKAIIRNPLLPRATWLSRNRNLEGIPVLQNETEKQILRRQTKCVYQLQAERSKQKAKTKQTFF